MGTDKGRDLQIDVSFETFATERSISMITSLIDDPLIGLLTKETASLYSVSDQFSRARIEPILSLESLLDRELCSRN
jgi:hypothetical protein